jgi:hypothetical protein
MQRAWLTITAEHATLRVDSASLPVPAPSEGYDCMVEASGWRWRFHAVAEKWTVSAAYGRGRVATVALHSDGSATAEPLQEHA